VLPGSDVALHIFKLTTPLQNIDFYHIPKSVGSPVKATMFSDMRTCSLIYIYLRFGRTFCLSLLAKKWIFLLLLIYKQHASPKRRCLLVDGTAPQLKYNNLRVNSKRFWRRSVTLRTNWFLDFVHRPETN
jgi:hypothetical protein